MLPTQILINLSIAFLWMFLNDTWNSLSFITGYIIGIAILFVLRRFFKKTFYLIKVLAIFKLFIVFIQELISSSILVIRQVTRPQLNITPGVFTLDTDLKGDWEVTILALLLSLTPGSIVLQVALDEKSFQVHAMDIPESRDVVITAKNKFEKAIKEVTR
ncbi:Na+/H+ antiporter subunit E [Halalkalibacter krulwichiae]|uniref:Na(+)/H(+) antiporter subunit E n=1 Tax=Halalkalibacter krulwichiae TaxID=199441 RepID=A0A1X9MGU7_9BACI|nr:Na+/H+ antiporter subunit E [Halalkalibacter krulwichiae]ARK31343.1 Na(+)/H(+) antiporter subunit E [Halalkalibacter krulwichiae]